MCLIPLHLLQLQTSMEEKDKTIADLEKSKMETKIEFQSQLHSKELQINEVKLEQEKVYTVKIDQ